MNGIFVVVVSISRSVTIFKEYWTNRMIVKHKITHVTAYVVGDDDKSKRSCLDDTKQTVLKKGQLYFGTPCVSCTYSENHEIRPPD